MVDTTLLQTLITVMKEDGPPAFFLNKQFDVYGFAQKLFKEIEAKRSSVTALTKAQAKAIGPSNLQFSNVKHESRINALYRLIGLPTNSDLDNNFSLMDEFGNNIANKQDLEKKLLQREYDQLRLTFKAYLSSNSLKDLNTKIDSTQSDVSSLIAQLFDPQNLKKHTTRLFPMVQYDKIQNVVESGNRISSSFASNDERYVRGALIPPPFLESVITIRLLQQSGGVKVNTQGAVEDAILQSLGYALSEIAKQYHRNQSEAEKSLIDGIALIRDKVNGVDSAAVKKGELEANTREPDNITTEIDIRSKYTQDQLKLYDAVISLLPTENDVIPIGTSINGTPFQSRNIKENALTNSFLSIVNSNIDAIQRSITNTNKVMQKRQLTQDKLTAELNSIIGDIGSISLAEIIIVLSSLFVLNEQDLVGLLSEARFNQLISATNNNTSTSSSAISSDGNADSGQKQINIFEQLKKFKSSTSTPRTSTTKAVLALQTIVKMLYDAFVVQLSTSHILSND